MRYYDNVERAPLPCSRPSMIPTYGKVQLVRPKYKSDTFKGKVSRDRARHRSQLTIGFFRVLLDASARRFQAQKIYLRAVAAARWVNMRNGILQGQRRHAGHTAALQQADNALRAVWDLHLLPTSPFDHSHDADEFHFSIGACHDHKRANCQRSANERLAGRTLASGRSPLADPSRLDQQPPIRQREKKTKSFLHGIFSFFILSLTHAFWAFASAGHFFGGGEDGGTGGRGEKKHT